MNRKSVVFLYFQFTFNELTVLLILLCVKMNKGYEKQSCIPFPFRFIMLSLFGMLLTIQQIIQAKHFLNNLEVHTDLNETKTNKKSKFSITNTLKI